MTTISEAASTMMRESAEILPVVEGDRLAGSITWKEILAAALGSLPRP